jgi:hypothetical protein
MNYEVARMVGDHVDYRLYYVNVGEKVTYRELFDKTLLDATTELEHQYVFEQAIAYLIAIGEIDLEHAGVNEEGEKLYVQTD